MGIIVGETANPSILGNRITWNGFANYRQSSGSQSPAMWLISISIFSISPIQIFFPYSHHILIERIV